MEGLERSLSNAQKTQFLRESLGETSTMSLWLTDMIYGLLGRVSPVDYALRVLAAQLKLKELNVRHRQSAKMMLERILLNLAPPIDPEHMDALSSENDSHSRASSLKPLNDAVIGENHAELITLRYKIFTEAFQKYLGIAVAILQNDMEEEELENFDATYRDFKERLRKPEKILVDCRQKLYDDFPEESLSSVHDAILRQEKDMKIRDDCEVEAEGDLKEKLAAAEKLLGLLRRSILEKAVSFIGDLEVLKERYSYSMNYYRQLFDQLQSYFDKEAHEEIHEVFDEYEKTVNEFFDVDKFVPESVIMDIQSGQIMSRA